MPLMFGLGVALRLLDLHYSKLSKHRLLLMSGPTLLVHLMPPLWNTPPSASFQGMGCLLRRSGKSDPGTVWGKGTDRGQQQAK